MPSSRSSICCATICSMRIWYWATKQSFRSSRNPGDPPHRPKRLWAQITGSEPPIRLFTYASGRGGKQAHPLYEGINVGAVLMSDGYEVYNAIVAARGVIYFGCWAHARRYFVEVEVAIPKPRAPEQPATQFRAKPCIAYSHSDRNSSVSWRTGAWLLGPSTTTCVKTRFVLSLWVAVIGWSPTPLPELISSRSSKRARQMALTPIRIWSICSGICPWQKTPMTSRHYCPGISPRQPTSFPIVYNLIILNSRTSLKERLP